MVQCWVAPPPYGTPPPVVWVGVVVLVVEVLVVVIIAVVLRSSNIGSSRRRSTSRSRSTGSNSTSSTSGTSSTSSSSSSSSSILIDYMYTLDFIRFLPISLLVMDCNLLGSHARCPECVKAGRTGRFQAFRHVKSCLLLKGVELWWCWFSTMWVDLQCFFLNVFI